MFLETFQRLYENFSEANLSYDYGYSIIAISKLTSESGKISESLAKTSIILWNVY